MRLLLRFMGFLFTAGTIVFLVGVTAVAGLLWHYSKDLPDYSQLQDYEPAVMTRVHASDGSLLAEYAHERRLYIPIQAVPKLVINAFVAAEDKSFYEHNGIDFQGIMRAGMAFVQNYGSGRRPQGASTITQQVAKNFLLTNELKFSRKIREALLAMKIERTFSKPKILELYLNEIYLGVGAYGVAAASLLYFDKSVHELTIPEAAYLAALPKGPNNYNPFRHHDEAIARRNYVIERMAEDHYITAQEAEQAKKDPLKVTTRPTGARIFAAEYFAEEVRRYIADNYSEQKLYEGGLSVRATLDPKLQLVARKALIDGLVRFDENLGYHGAVTKIDLAGEWGAKLAEVRALADVAPWRLAVVLETGDQAARIGLQPGRDPAGLVLKDRETGTVPLEAVKWAKSGTVKTVTKVSQVLVPGDVVYVEPLTGKDGQWRLRQVPEISGAIMAMEPYTGRVLAMVGGFSYDQSQFNRATQALRQPGSSFKPIVYSAALDNGYTPSSIVLDAPLEIDTGSGIWRPENYEQNFYGPSTLRFGIEHSRNVMTVRLAQDIGMPLIGEYAKRLGVYDNLPPYLSYALGAGETTLMRMVGAYAMIDNGGRKIQPTLIDRIQDRYGHTIYKHDQRECRGCDAPKWTNQSEPSLVDRRERVLDPMTAYQITSIMEGVPIRGTAAASGIKDLGKHIAGKTGTTNDEKDVWFIGFSPDLVVGVFMGYDKPRHIADRATGGALAAPIFRDFMKVALADKPSVPFQAPVGIKLVRVNVKTGMRAVPGDSQVILEAFKPGTAPPDGSAVVGVTDPDGRPLTVSPEADRAVRTGGGIY
ncbi:MAG TPA: penicillin-binding protein 1A [Xanthobacteraceae bacterium]|jgi:penicillin-binding protein 1A|nr:penicillin-binding protein 1A [Xanthobacteraceae bacterium]